MCLYLFDEVLTDSFSTIKEIAGYEDKERHMP